MRRFAQRQPGPRINRSELVMVAVIGQASSQLAAANPYRIGQDGRPRVLPGPGGIVLSHRVGDACVGLAADHVEPGVSLRNEQTSIKGERGGANLALQTLACIGNQARVVTGRAAGAIGTVTGKHGGIDTVLIDFPQRTLRRLAIGDRIQIWAHGQGLRLLDHPGITAMNIAPRFLARWRPPSTGGRLVVGVTHLVPAALMGSGLGRNDAVRGDHDIQLFDPATVRRYRLGSLRFGDLVAIVDADHRFGRSWRRGHVAIGCVVHSESSVAGHGPGVTTLLTGAANRFVLRHDANANVAAILGLRRPATPRNVLPLAQREAAWRATLAHSSPVASPPVASAAIDRRLLHVRL